MKLLKDNLWVVMKNQLADQKEDSPDKEEEEEEVAENRLPLISKVLFKMFYVHTDQSRQRIYQLVLFYFVLHLANEHGLAIQSNEAHNNLTIIGS